MVCAIGFINLTSSRIIDCIISTYVGLVRALVPLLYLLVLHLSILPLLRLPPKGALSDNDEILDVHHIDDVTIVVCQPRLCALQSHVNWSSLKSYHLVVQCSAINDIFSS